jgi:transcriptional regulator with XRE-family HTH domain
MFEIRTKWAGGMRMTNTIFDEFVQDAGNRRIFEQESLAIEATELISELMEQRQFRKADLAKQIGKSKAFVTQVLSGSRNITMHTFADLACALGHRIVLNSEPLESATATVPSLRLVPRTDNSLSDGKPADALSAPSGKPAKQLTAPAKSKAKKAK